MPPDTISMPARLDLVWTLFNPDLISRKTNCPPYAKKKQRILMSPILFYSILFSVESEFNSHPPLIFK